MHATTTRPVAAALLLAAPRGEVREHLARRCPSAGDGGIQPTQRMLVKLRVNLDAQVKAVENQAIAD